MIVIKAFRCFEIIQMLTQNAHTLVTAYPFETLM